MPKVTQPTNSRYLNLETGSRAYVLNHSDQSYSVSAVCQALFFPAYHRNEEAIRTHVGLLENNVIYTQILYYVYRFLGTTDVYRKSGSMGKFPAHFGLEIGFEKWI